MSPEARLYRVEIMRAAYGDRAHEAKVADVHRLNQICEHLAECEQAQTIIRAKGHGGAGMSFVEVARSVPDNVREKLKRFFGAPPAARCPDLSEADGGWSLR